MFTIKQAQSELELHKILQLRYKILREPWNQSLESATDHLEQESVNAYIENDEGLAIACGRLQKNENGMGQIRFMAVDASYQGNGLGRDILVFLEQQAQLRGIQKIELQARENAVVFYERNGYTIREKSFLLWGLIQHYLMVKDLTEGGRRQG